jgi:hypothetical protein
MSRVLEISKYTTWGLTVIKSYIFLYIFREFQFFHQFVEMITT